MSVLVETTIGDLIFDLYIEERPRSCLNFLKLCKIKYYNFCLFHSIRRNFIAQCGDPTGTGRGGQSIYASLHGPQAKYYELETKPRIRHQTKGTISFVNNGNNMHGSQFFITLGDNLDFLDGKHTVFGRLAEGSDILEKLNETICDDDHKPFQDVRISHTIVLDDPFEDPKGLTIPDRSPEPTQEQLDSGRIAAGEDINEEKTKEEVQKELEEKELKIGTKILETIGDIDDAEEKPPENILFICKLNPVTNEDDLKIIFSRFGKIVSCEIIKDHKTGDSLCYGFVEFKEIESCEKAYFKMDNVLIDDRRIHVDFCQSMAKIQKHHKQASAKYGTKEKTEVSSNYKLKENIKNDKYSMVFEKDRESKKIEEKLKYQKRRENPKPIRDKIRNKRERSESESDAADRRPSKKAPGKSRIEARKGSVSSGDDSQSVSRSPTPEDRRSRRKPDSSPLVSKYNKNRNQRGSSNEKDERSFKRRNSPSPDSRRRRSNDKDKDARRRVSKRDDRSLSREDEYSARKKTKTKEISLVKKSEKSFEKNSSSRRHRSSSREDDDVIDRKRSTRKVSPVADTRNKSISRRKDKASHDRRSESDGSDSDVDGLSKRLRKSDIKSVAEKKGRRDSKNRDYSEDDDDRKKSDKRKNVVKDSDRALKKSASLSFTSRKKKSSKYSSSEDEELSDHQSPAAGRKKKLTPKKDSRRKRHDDSDEEQSDNDSVVDESKATSSSQRRRRHRDDLSPSPSPPRTSSSAKKHTVQESRRRSKDASRNKTESSRRHQKSLSPEVSPPPRKTKQNPKKSSSKKLSSRYNSDEEMESDDDNLSGGKSYNKKKIMASDKRSGSKRRYSDDSDTEDYSSKKDEEKTSHSSKKASVSTSSKNLKNKKKKRYSSSEDGSSGDERPRDRKTAKRKTSRSPRDRRKSRDTKKNSRKRDSSSERSYSD